MSNKEKVTLQEVMQNSGEWLTVGPISKKIGVHVDTIRRWASAGRIKSVRHPINNYRLFLLSDIESEKVDESGK